MPSFVTRTVGQLLSARPGLQRVQLDDGTRALVFTQLTGEVDAGDAVVVNTTAVELGLGTGGWHIVHWNLRRTELHQPGPGHIMKLRYTSLQIDTGAAEEAHPDGGMGDLGGAPVVVCGLHSQVGVVAAAVASTTPAPRVAYVMTDGAALPLALSDLVADLETQQLVHLTLTAGHAFGGRFEAVNVPSALDLAVRVGAADVVIVAMGPGVVGTSSALGTTAVEVAAIVDAASRMGGDPIVALRASGVDPRPRHRGVSHHTRTALMLCHSRATIGVPRGEGLELLLEDLAGLEHDVAEVDVGDVAALLDASGVRVATMGRGPSDDPLFFRASAAAGLLAGERAASAGTVQA
jgi:Protein of unknown function (DUF3866)